MRFDFPFCGFCRLKFEKEREEERERESCQSWKDKQREICNRDGGWVKISWICL